MHTIGRIDKNIYKCVAGDIVTDEVIITDERIAYIIQRRGKIFTKNMVNILLKYWKIRIIYFPIKYKNSIITAVGENEKRFAQRLRNNKPLYKKE